MLRWLWELLWTSESKRQEPERVRPQLMRFLG